MFVKGGKCDVYCEVCIYIFLTDKSINMYVICQSGGSLCICYQLPHRKLGSSKPSSRRQSKSKLQIPSTILSGSGQEGQVQKRPGSLDLSQSAGRRDDPAGPLPNTPGRTGSSPTPASLGRLATPTSPLMDSSLTLSYDSITNIGEASPQSWSTLNALYSDSLTSSRTSLDGRLNQKLPEPGSPATPRSSSQSVDVHYVVLVLHHKTILHCSVPHLQKSIAKRMQLFFAPLSKWPCWLLDIDVMICRGRFYILFRL